MPQIDDRVTKGNIISIIATMLTALGMLAVTFAWTGRQGQRIENAAQATQTNALALAAHEARIRAVETSTARQDERLLLILDTVRKIEARLERSSP